MKEQKGSKEIHRKLKTIYGDGAMKQMKIHWWMSEVQREYEDTSDSLYQDDRRS
jgi:hypothetical protein